MQTSKISKWWRSQESENQYTNDTYLSKKLVALLMSEYEQDSNVVLINEAMITVLSL